MYACEVGGKLWHEVVEPRIGLEGLGAGVHAHLMEIALEKRDACGVDELALVPNLDA